MSQVRRFRQRLPKVGGHLVEQRFRGCRIIVHQPGQASQIDGKCDEVLLNAIVEGALDRATIGVRGLDQTFP
jgi:hypothetical protein